MLKTSKAQALLTPTKRAEGKGVEYERKESPAQRVVDVSASK
jgi:hypothetical protein